MTHLGPSLRRAKVRERPGRRVAFAVGASLLFNLAIFALLARVGAFEMAAPADVKRVSLAPISADKWAANRAIGGAQPAERKPATPFAMPRPKPQPPTPPPEPKPDAKGQVVDLGPTNDKTPKDARFLSEHDSSVEKETRSRHAKAGYERALPTPSAPGAQASAPSGQGGKADRNAPGLEGAPGEKRSDEQKVATLTPKPSPSPSETGDLGAPRASREGLAPLPAPGEGGEGGQRRSGTPNENPLIAPGTLARIAGGPAPDYLPDVEEGEGTFLNARQWKYATYFNRIKQAVSATWDPRTPLVSRDPDGKTFGRRDRATLVDVTLDESGHLKSIVVAHTSGLDFLDRAAVSAFQRAEPFMNPPHGIVDERGEIRFGFNFVLEFGHPGYRIYRAPLPGE